MKINRSSAVLALVLAAAAVPAHAVQADIKVWADIDTTLALMRADGSALPDVVQMSHNPASGLVPWSDQVRIFSNDTTRDVAVRLGNPAELLPMIAAPGATAVPLTISLNDVALSTAEQDFTARELFDGALPGASIAMPLRIAQTTQERIGAAGLYEGIVTIVMAQKAGSP